MGVVQEWGIAEVTKLHYTGDVFVFSRILEDHWKHLDLVM